MGTGAGATCIGEGTGGGGGVSIWYGMSSKIMHPSVTVPPCFALPFGRIALVNNTVDIPLAPITIDGVGDGLVLALIGCRPAGEVRELAVVLPLGAAVGLTEPEDRADHVLTEFLTVGDGGEVLDDDGGGWARRC